MKNQMEKGDDVLFWTFYPWGYKITPLNLRAWYNGSTSASQAEDEGSIPFARTTLRVRDASYGAAIANGEEMRSSVLRSLGEAGRNSTGTICIMYI